MVRIQEIENYKNYGRVLSLSNGIIKAYVTLDIGPRIIFFGFEDGENILFDKSEEFALKTDEKYEALFGKGRVWNNFGGHRVWITPEAWPETYTPDDKKVSYSVTENGAVFTKEPDREVGIAITLEVIMDSDDANVRVNMTVKNISSSEKEFSIWGITVSSQGGTLIIPMNTNNTGLLANRNISVWPYSELNDERVYFGKKYVTLKQDPKSNKSFKLGFDLNCGNVYYINHSDVFLKSFETNHPEGFYPDNNCSFETYTDGSILEVESLSEIKTIKPSQEHKSCERWSLLKQPCEIDFKSDSSIDEFFKKL